MPKRRKQCPEGQQRCVRCHRCKPLSEFSPGNKRDKRCQRIYQKEYFAQHPEKYEAHLQRNRLRRRKNAKTREDG